MAFKKTDLTKAIIFNLATLSRSVALENTIGLFDSNRGAQVFFAGLFNLIFDYSLGDLDISNNTTNFPAVDLGDSTNRLALQVTTDESSTKINETLSKFHEYKLYENYDRIVIFILGSRLKYRENTFTKYDEFQFDSVNDIWDDETLVNQINSISDVVRLENILNYLKENLLQFSFPETLFPQDIKNCIEILARDFGTKASLQNEITNRDSEDFITEKNNLNGISWDFFKEKIEGHIKYNKEINDFLSNPINKNVQDTYFQVAQAIQDYYKENSRWSFDDIFRGIFNRLNTYDDSISGVTVKLRILLHNMYFNCDIGNNPQ